jgi:hypothetical protein
VTFASSLSIKRTALAVGSRSNFRERGFRCSVGDSFELVTLFPRFRELVLERLGMAGLSNPRWNFPTESRLMTNFEKDILAVLDELDTAVKAMPTANPKPNLMPLFERLDSLTSQLPREASPDLRHYLQRKSYEKARLWLLGRGAENARGACGH